MILRWFGVFCGVVSSSLLVAQNYTISTVAGGASTSSISGAATSIGAVSDVAFDSRGTGYFVSPDRHQVFSIDTQGRVNVFAGGGVQGFSGDNGPAVSAQLNFPVGLMVNNATGEVLIADYGNGRVRSVSRSGIITTIAGGGKSLVDNTAATQFQLFPSSMATDGTNLYIASANRIVILASGKIKTMTVLTSNAPSGAYAIRAWAVLAFSNGSLYYNDGCKVNRFRLSTNATTVIAGTGVCGYVGDNGSATVGQTDMPDGIAVDSLGNVYLSDPVVSVIRMVSGGRFSTVAGTGRPGYNNDGGAQSTQLNHPGGIALAADGSIYIADSGNSRLRAYLPQQKTVQTIAGMPSGVTGDGLLATSSVLNGPNASVRDPAGNLYIADRNNHVVRRVDAVTGIITTYAGNGTPGNSGDNGPATSAQINDPVALAIDTQGSLLISDYASDRVRIVYAGLGTITTVIGGTSITNPQSLSPLRSIHGPSGIAVDPQGRIFFAETGTNSVRVVEYDNSLQTTVMRTYAGSGTCGSKGDHGLAVSAQLCGPAAVALDRIGNLAIADTEDCLIRIVDPTGFIYTTAGVASNPCGAGTGDGTNALGATLQRPSALAYDQALNLYFADSSDSTVRRVAAGNNIIQTIAGFNGPGFAGETGLASKAQFSYPYGLSSDPAGNLYVSDSGNDRIRKITNPCSYSYNPSRVVIDSNTGGTGSFTLTTQPGCGWTVLSTASWVTTEFTRTPTGGIIKVIAAANTGITARYAPLVVGDTNFEVVQAGPQPCRYAIDPLSFIEPLAAFTNPFVAVTAPAGCEWSVTSADPAIQIMNPGRPQFGTGTMGFAGSAVSSPLGRLTTSITVAGVPVPIVRTDSAVQRGPIISNGPGSGCTPPIDSHGFITTADPAAYLWFAAVNLHPQDHLVVNWIQPDGKLYQSMAYPPYNQGDSLCYQSSLPIGPQTAIAGVWTAIVTLEGAQFTRISFSINIVPAVFQNSISISGGGTASDDITGGALFTVRGTMITSKALPPQLLPLPATVNGLQIKFDQLLAHIVSATDSQVTFQAPWGLSNDQTTIKIGTFATVTKRIVDASPSVLTSTGLSDGAPLVTRLDGNGKSLGAVSPTNPARPGDQLLILATGLGLVAAPPNTGNVPAQATAPNAEITATLGDVTCTVLSAVLSPGAKTPGDVGVYLVTIQVPPEVPFGNAVNLVVSADELDSNPVPVALAGTLLKPKITLNALSTMNAAPFALVDMQADGLAVDAPAVAQFVVDGAYAEAVAIKDIQPDGTFNVPVPPYYDGLAKKYSAGKVSVQIRQLINGVVTASNRMDGFQIQDLPTVNLPPGSFTSEFLHVGQESSSAVRGVLTYNESASGGVESTANARNEVTNSITAAGTLQGLIDMVTQSKVAAPVGTLNGQPVAFDIDTLSLLDRMLAAQILADQAETDVAGLAYGF